MLVHVYMIEFICGYIHAYLKEGVDERERGREGEEGNLVVSFQSWFSNTTFA